MSSALAGGPAPGAMRTVPSPGRVTGGPGPPVRRTRSVVAPATTVEPGVDGRHAVHPGAVDEHPVGGAAVLDTHPARADADEEVASAEGLVGHDESVVDRPPQVQPRRDERMAAAGIRTTDHDEVEEAGGSRRRRRGPTARVGGHRGDGDGGAVEQRRHPHERVVGHRAAPGGQCRAPARRGGSTSAAQQLGRRRPARPLDHDVDRLRPSSRKVHRQRDLHVGHRRKVDRRRGRVVHRPRSLSMDGWEPPADRVRQPAHAAPGGRPTPAALVGRPRGRPPRGPGLAVGPGAGRGSTPCGSPSGATSTCCVGGWASGPWPPSVGLDTDPASLARIEVLNRVQRRPLRRDRGRGGAVGHLAVRPGGVRGGAVVGAARRGGATPLGIDLEVVEPRSDGFVTDFLTPGEQDWVRGPAAARPPARSRRRGEPGVVGQGGGAQGAARSGCGRTPARSRSPSRPTPDADGWAPLHRGPARSAGAAGMVAPRRGATSSPSPPGARPRPPDACSRVPPTWPSRRRCTAGSAGRWSAPRE